MKERLIRRIIGILLTVMMVSTVVSCGKNENQVALSGSEQSENEDESDIVNANESEEQELTDYTEEWEEFATQMRQKYETNEKVIYTDGMYDIPRDYVFDIKIGFDTLELGLEMYSEIVALYEDPELTDIVSTTYAWADENYREFTMSSRIPKYQIARGHDEEGSLPGYSEDSYVLFEREEGHDWGNLDVMYMAQWRDYETGEELEKPIVTVITLKGELEAPVCNLSSTEDGIVRFDWNEIEGAEEYFIVRYDQFADGMTNAWVDIIGRTTDNYWEARTEDDSWRANTEFKTYLFSEADWLDDNYREYLSEEYPEATAEDGPIIMNHFEEADQYYAVIAVNSMGTSVLSNRISIFDIAPLFANETVEHAGEDEEYEFSQKQDSIAMMPAYQWVIMCDGCMVQKRVEYDFDAALAENKKMYVYDPDNIEETATIEYWDILTVPYTIDGTPFHGTMTVQKINMETWQTELEAIERRQNALKTYSGMLNRQIYLAEEGGEQDENVTVGIYIEKVTASSALSEYLAVSMINSVEYIDLKLFPEASDPDYLTDAWLEAIYQNPLTLGVTDAHFARNGQGLYITYEEDADVRRKQQEEIQEAVTEIVANIITEDMTDVEKEYAINQYLCETAEYDMAALESAEQNNFMHVDPQYNDSFNAYGILINKVGVCSGYAAAFKLLADEAGLESIVVTGYLDGATPHAWNRVNLEGNWETIDVTNNDNEYLMNALLNLPDAALRGTLVEDEEYILDTQLGYYVSDNTTYEYYHMNDKFFSLEEIAGQFVEQLKENNTVILRTDYALTDEQFYEVAYEVIDMTGEEDLGGCHWLGVILLTREY